METVKIVFVILHYNVVEETEKCIASIEKNVDSKYKIIVIDNASPNQTGKILEEKYAEHRNIHIIINEKNEGFSKGNNIGCRYAIENFSPDYLCVMNNDTELMSNNIAKIIDEEYEKEKFDILGPKIWNTVFGYNQNPCYKVANLQQAKQRYRETLLTHISIKCNLNLVLRVIFKINSIAFPQKNEGNNKAVHGSVIIFSKDYYNKYHEIFMEKTFMYGEEAMINYRRIKDKLKIVFNFEIEFLHNHGVSTSNANINNRKKMLFQAENMHKASKVILELYEKES